MKMKTNTAEALCRIFAILLLWGCFAPIASFARYFTGTAAADALLEFIDRKLFWYQAVAAIGLYTLFRWLKWTSKSEADAKRAGNYASLVREEGGGVLISFGSLSLVVGLAAGVYVLCWAILPCYLVGFFLIRKR